MKKTMCKAALTLVAAIAMILLVAVCIAVPAYASEGLSPENTQFGATIGKILLVFAGVTVLGGGVAVATDHPEWAALCRYLAFGLGCAMGVLFGSKGWLW